MIPVPILSHPNEATIVKHTLFWIAFLVLVVLHHDWWFWNDGRLLFGFLPVGLAYHAVISLAAASLWAWAVFSAMRDVFDGGDAEPESS
jgi:hypothetical protein